MRKFQDNLYQGSPPESTSFKDDFDKIIQLSNFNESVTYEAFKNVVDKTVCSLQEDQKIMIVSDEEQQSIAVCMTSLVKHEGKNYGKLLENYRITNESLIKLMRKYINNNVPADNIFS